MAHLTSSPPGHLPPQRPLVVIDSFIVTVPDSSRRHRKVSDTFALAFERSAKVASATTDLR